MITHIRVDGFRSLSNFELNLNSGINILVGPNGAGKTNIVQFFELLSNITRLPLGDAVSVSGGAGSLFRKSVSDEFSKSLLFEVVGRIEKPTDNYGDLRGKYLHYRYIAEVTLSPERDFIYYSNQELSFLSGNKLISTRQIKENRVAWDLQLNVNFDQQGNCDAHVQRLKTTKVNIREEVSSEKDINPKRALAGFFQLNAPSDVNLFDLLSYRVWQATAVEGDLRGGQVLNIDPSRVRQYEDAARPPGIQKDGSGLAATLYHLQGIEEKSSRFRRRGQRKVFMRFGPFRRFFSRNSFRRIESLLKLVNPAVVEIAVSNAPLDNRIDISVILKGPDGNLSLPFTAMSDGTVKWLALVAAILTSGTVLAVEEPENFIHPLMQQEIIQVMRSTMERRPDRGFVIITTHSETLLNAADPSEVVVVSMVNGITKAHRPGERAVLKNLINETGFSLGHFYVTGALDNA